MKKSACMLGFCVCIAQFAFGQINVNSTGGVGVGTSNLYDSNGVTIAGDNIMFQGKTNSNTKLLLTLDPSGYIDLSTYHTNYSCTLGGNEQFGVIYSADGVFVGVYSDYGNFNYLSCTEFYNYSDKSLKRNINPLLYNRETFKRLNPVSFDISDSLLISEREKKSGKKPDTIFQYGFIAQEIQDFILNWSLKMKKRDI